MSFFKWAKPGLFFVFFCSFLNTNFTGKTVDVSGIRTRIVGVEGEHTDHLTTTTALRESVFVLDRERESYNLRKREIERKLQEPEKMVK